MAPFDLDVAPLRVVCNEEVEDAPLVWFLAKGGNLSEPAEVESSAVLRRCFDDPELWPFSSGGNGDGTTLITGGVASGTAFMSIFSPSRRTTTSPTLLLELLTPFKRPPCLESLVMSKLIVEF